MDMYSIILVVGFVLKILLDLFTMHRSSSISDILYGLLGMVIGGAALMQNSQDNFGYIGIIGGICFFGYGVYKSKSRGQG
ncbi:MAG: hypothetical protein K8F27_05165 [Sulfuricellaceae bacterium]|nr:hypothetical protein [Sulfuricellaceae bacterium]